MTTAISSLHTLDEAAELWRISKQSVFRLMRRGEIEVVRIGGRTFIETSEIERIIETGRQRASSTPLQSESPPGRARGSRRPSDASG